MPTPNQAAQRDSQASAELANNQDVPFTESEMVNLVRDKGPGLIFLATMHYPIGAVWLTPDLSDHARPQVRRFLGGQGPHAWWVAEPPGYELHTERVPPASPLTIWGVILHEGRLSAHGTGDIARTATPQGRRDAWAVLWSVALGFDPLMSIRPASRVNRASVRSLHGFPSADVSEVSSWTSVTAVAYLFERKADAVAAHVRRGGVVPTRELMLV